jgi:hypothetical protein
VKVTGVIYLLIASESNNCSKIKPRRAGQYLAFLGRGGLALLVIIKRDGEAGAGALTGYLHIGRLDMQRPFSYQIHDVLWYSVHESRVAL